MRYDIFISYRRDGGYETAKHLNDLLVRDGFNVSFDIDTLRNGDFDRQLFSRIDECADFILIINEHAFDRTIDPTSEPSKDRLRCELAYALKKGKNIIPILLAGAKMPDNLPDDVKDVVKKNGPIFNSYFFDTFYNDLKERFLISKARTKVCPYCGEEILVVAKKCKHCGEWLDNEIEKEKIPCPICGEQIDSDMETCPYCDEPTHFLEGHSEKQKLILKEKVSKDTDSDFCLYCKSCKEKLSVDTETCNSCGDKDPFFIKKIANLNEASAKIGSYLAFGLLILAVILLHNYLPIWLLIVGGIIFYIILGLVLANISRNIFFRSEIDKYENIIRQFYTNIGHPTAFDNWKKLVDEITS